MVALGLPVLDPMEKDLVSLNLCKVHCTAPFETLTLSAILRCDVPSLLNAIIWSLVPSLRSLEHFDTRHGKRIVLFYILT